MDEHEIDELVTLALRLIEWEPRWYHRFALSTRDRAQIATLALTVAIYKELRERPA